jgi:hypothetical protein
MNFLLANVRTKFILVFFIYKYDYLIGSEGTKSAYTADEFRRLFRIYFNQDFVKEKVLNQTIEIFLNEQERSFALFEYAVELINEVFTISNKINSNFSFLNSWIIFIMILKINENIFQIFFLMIISIHLLLKIYSQHLRLIKIFFL